MTRPTIRRRLAVATQATFLAILAACTLVTAEDAGQCRTDAECTARGPEFASTRCSARGMCESVRAPDAGSDGGSSCASNAECVRLLGASARCVESRCVPLTGTACGVIDGDATDDRALFVGVVTPRTGANSPFGFNQYSVVVQAARDWNQQVEGSPTAHTFVTIGCDEADPVAAVSFLAQARVTAILGPFEDDKLQAAAPVAASAKLPLLAPRFTDLRLPQLIGTGRTLFSFAPGRALQLKYLNPLVAALEPSVRATFDLAASAPIKLVLAAAADPSSSGFVDAAEAILRFNGKSKADNGAQYQRLNFTANYAAVNDYSAAVAGLVAAAPHVVVVTQDYDVANFVKALEAGWPSSGTALPRIVLLTQDSSVETDQATPGRRFAGKIDFMRWRRTPAQDASFTTFSTSFRSAVRADPAPFSERIYDAFYAHAYATHVVLKRNGDVTTQIDSGSYGAALAGLAAPGILATVGGTGVPQALSTIAGGGDLDLDGASGPLELDVTAESSSFGGVVQDAELRCIQAGGVVASSGISFTGATGAATGTYSCL